MLTEAGSELPSCRADIAFTLAYTLEWTAAQKRRSGQETLFLHQLFLWSGLDGSAGANCLSFCLSLSLSLSLSLGPVDLTRMASGPPKPLGAIPVLWRRVSNDELHCFAGKPQLSLLACVRGMEVVLGYCFPDIFASEKPLELSTVVTSLVPVFNSKPCMNVKASAECQSMFGFPTDLPAGASTEAIDRAKVFRLQGAGG